MTGAVLFDVNETMLDLRALDPLFADWFGDAKFRDAWFAQTLHFAMTLAATCTFRSFSEVGGAALATIADRYGVDLPEQALPRLAGALRRIPAHGDVAPAIVLLQEAGFRIAALSNNPLPVLQEQLRFAAIGELFDEIISVDEAGALKPAPEVYHFAARRLTLQPGSIWMVAAHGWDVAGATRAGLRGAFVDRPGQAPDPFAPPEIIGRDLNEVAKAIIAISHDGQRPEYPEA